MDHDRRLESERAPDSDLGDDLLNLSDKLREMARELVSDNSGARASGIDRDLVGALNDRVLAAIALSIYRARQRRHRYFDAALFGEPGWDILLELFINKAEGVQLSTSSICLASGAPSTTALRTLAKLEQQGLTRRFRAARDRRLVKVELTELGYKLVRNYISDGIMREEMPLPQYHRAA